MKQRPLAVVALPLKPPTDRPAPRVLLSEADMAKTQVKSWPLGAHACTITGINSEASTSTVSTYDCMSGSGVPTPHACFSSRHSRSCSVTLTGVCAGKFQKGIAPTLNILS